MVIYSERIISTNIKLPVISLSVVKPRSGRKLKLFLKLILARLLFDIQSLLLFKFISKYSKQISQVLFCAFLCVELHVLCESIFPKKDVHAFFGVCYTFNYKLIGLSLH